MLRQKWLNTGEFFETHINVNQLVALENAAKKEYGEHISSASGQVDNQTMLSKIAVASAEVDMQTAQFDQAFGSGLVGTEIFVSEREPGVIKEHYFGGRVATSLDRAGLTNLSRVVIAECSLEKSSLTLFPRVLTEESEQIRAYTMPIVSGGEQQIDLWVPHQKSFLGQLTTMAMFFGGMTRPDSKH